MTATCTLTNGTTQNVSSQCQWLSTTPSIANFVDAGPDGGAGLLQTYKQGTVMAECPYPGPAIPGLNAGSSTVTVGPAACMSVAVTPANPTIAKGLSAQMTGTVTEFRRLEEDVRYDRRTDLHLELQQPGRRHRLQCGRGHV